MAATKEESTTSDAVSTEQVGKQLFDLINSHDTNKFTELIEILSKSKKHDLNKIINEITYGDDKCPLIVCAAKMNNITIVELLATKYNVCFSYIKQYFIIYLLIYILLYTYIGRSK